MVEWVLHVAKLRVHGIYTQGLLGVDDNGSHGPPVRGTEEGRCSSGDISPAARRTWAARSPSCSGEGDGSGGGVLVDGRWLEHGRL